MFRPLKDFVLIKRADANPAQTSPGGIILPEQVQEKPNHGTVIAVGAGNVLEDGTVRPLDVVPGNVVVFDRKSGNNEIQLQGETYLVMREWSVYGVLE